MEKIIIAGRVGQDATIKEINGIQYTSFSVAVDNSYKNQDGTRVEKTNWYNCLKTGTGIAPYIQKGQFLVVSGRPAPRIYRDQQGQAQISLNVMADQVTLGPNPNKQSEGYSSPENKPQNQSQSKPSGAHSAMQSNSIQNMEGGNFEDDLPF